MDDVALAGLFSKRKVACGAREANECRPWGVDWTPRSRDISSTPAAKHLSLLSSALDLNFLLPKLFKPPGALTGNFYKSRHRCLYLPWIAITTCDCSYARSTSISECLGTGNSCTGTHH